MTIYGVAFLSACYLAGQLLGEGLGQLLGIQANVGGVGFAMLLLIVAGDWWQKHHAMPLEAERGIQFWSHLYIPVIVAMSATQNVRVAFSSGGLALLAGIVPTACAFALIPLLARFFKSPIA